MAHFAHRGGIAGALRDLAADLDVAMIAVSSTGRANYKAPKEGADDPISYLGTAKESGDVEFAASNLIFLDVAADHVAGVHAARLVVAKARRGETGFVGATFDGPSGRWAPEAGSLEALEAGKRHEAASARRQRDDDAAVLRCIATKASSSWSALRERFGMSKARADAARDRLLESGQIEGAEEVYQDVGGRKQRRVVLRLVSAPPLPIGGEM